MSKYSDFLKDMKENQINKFFGEVAKEQNDTEIALGWTK